MRQIALERIKEKSQAWLLTNRNNPRGGGV
jgi:hypothetical protein